MRDWYARFTPEQRRHKRGGRDAERIREQDRRKMAKRRRTGTPEQRLKITARSEVRKAIQRGDLQRGPCEQAGPSCSGPIHAHHDDYAKPLDVRWLCRGHHELHHESETPLL